MTQITQMMKGKIPVLSVKSVYLCQLIILSIIPYFFATTMLGSGEPARATLSSGKA
jgi:hypothetical protein